MFMGKFVSAVVLFEMNYSLVILSKFNVKYAGLDTY